MAQSVTFKTVRIKARVSRSRHSSENPGRSLLQRLVISRSRSTLQHRMAFDLVAIRDCTRDADFCWAVDYCAAPRDAWWGPAGWRSWTTSRSSTRTYCRGRLSRRDAPSRDASADAPSVWTWQRRVYTRTASRPCALAGESSGSTTCRTACRSSCTGIHGRG